MDHSIWAYMVIVIMWVISLFTMRKVTKEYTKKTVEMELYQKIEKQKNQQLQEVLDETLHHRRDPDALRKRLRDGSF